MEANTSPRLHVKAAERRIPVGSNKLLVGCTRDPRIAPNESGDPMSRSVDSGNPATRARTTAVGPSLATRERSGSRKYSNQERPPVGERLKFQVGFGMAEHSNPPRKNLKISKRLESNWEHHNFLRIVDISKPN
jgi:hypothetical protein